MATFSERLNEIMKLRGIDQAGLTRLTGIDKSSISSYVHGKYRANQDKLYLLAKALNVNETWLMGYDVPMQRSMLPVGEASEVKAQHDEIFNSLSPESQQQALDYMRFLASLERKDK